MASTMSPLLTIALEQTIAELSDEWHGVFSHETVARYVTDAYDQIGDRPTVGPNFLPVIIRRFAYEQLCAVAQVQGQLEKAVPEVLFVCERNAGRSQMAAALTHRIARGQVAVRSAGSRPGRAVDPVVAEVMAEIGIDLSQEFPKPLTDAVVQAADVVVTMGCGDACAIFPAHRYLDWAVPDPTGQPIEIVRQIRYEIYHHVWDLIDCLQPGASLADLHLTDQGTA